MKNLVQGHQGPVRRADLGQKWEQEHKVLLHNSQEALPRCSENSLSTKMCRFLGACTCKDQNGQLALLFWRKLVRTLKVYLVKINKKPSKQRRQFETGGFVLGLRPDASQRLLNPPADEVSLQEVFFHVGNADYRTWDWGCMHLRKLSFDEMSGITTVCALDEDHRIVVKSAVQYFKEFVVARFAWSLQYYILLSDDVPVEALRMMPSQFLSVKEHLNPYPFWKGAHMETSRRKRQNRPPTTREPIQRRQAERSGPSSSRPSRRPATAMNASLDLDLDFEAEPELTAGAEPQPQPESDNDSDWMAEELDSLWRDLHQDDEDEEPFEDTEEFVKETKDAFDQLVAEWEAEAAAAGGAEAEPSGPSGLAEPESLAPRHALDMEQQVPDNPIVPEPEQPSSKRPRLEPEKPRATKVPEEVFLLPEPVGGEIRYNVRGFLRAHCPAHGPTCTRQRQTTQGKSYGSGRPIGMLVAWLEDASRCKSKAEHVAQPPQAFLRRQAARELFQSWPGSGGMLGHERPQSAIESSEEPDEIK